MSEELVLVYHAGTVAPLLQSATHSLSWFGGPLENEVTGESLIKPLHHIATLHLSHLQANAGSSNVWQLPLVHGLFYDSGLLRYDFKKFGGIRIQPGLLGEPARDWPYRGYPDSLPFVPLEIGTPTKESWESFRERAPNLPGKQPSEMVVLVPPPATIGFSMWGRSGDAEGVTLVFECDVKDQTVTTYNVCS